MLVKAKSLLIWQNPSTCHYSRTEDYDIFAPSFFYFFYLTHQKTFRIFFFQKNGKKRTYHQIRYRYDRNALGVVWTETFLPLDLRWHLSYASGRHCLDMIPNCSDVRALLKNPNFCEKKKFRWIAFGIKRSDASGKKIIIFVFIFSKQKNKIK